MKPRDVYRTLMALALGVILLLSACQQAPDLAGSDWNLVRLRDDPLIAGTTITAEFIVGPWIIEGSAGCNSYQAIYDRDGDQIRIDADAIVVEEEICEQPEGIMEQEQAYLETLTAVRRYRVEDNQLQMLDGAGNSILIYDPQ